MRHSNFRARVAQLVNTHPIVTENVYTRWFADGKATRAQVRDLTIQFSVFSNAFVEAQLRKVINASDLHGFRSGKEILLNELGVPFGSGGSVDGATFSFRAAHFEWLVQFASHLGLSFEQLGKRRHASAATLAFCDALMRLYGAEDPWIASGASFAIEHWAAAGFWKELVSGLRAFKRRECQKLPLGFWTWHDLIEEQHAQHTDDELTALGQIAGFGEERFIEGASGLLAEVQGFWLGLWERACQASLNGDQVRLIG